MTDAKATICYLNGISLNTINDVEKILRALPQKGTRCEVQTTKALNGEPRGRGTADVIASKSMQIRDEVKPLSLSPQGKKSEPAVSSPPVSQKKKKQRQPSIVTDSCPDRSAKCPLDKSSRISTSIVSTTLAAKTMTPSSPKFQCKMLTEQVRVSPIIACNGVILELDVEVTIPDGGGEKKTLKLEIECPDFVPARIKIGKKWKNIV